MEDGEMTGHNIVANTLCECLKRAMYEWPSIPVTQIIEEAMDFKYPTRTYDPNSKEKVERWKFTNEEIAAALDLYVKMRHVRKTKTLKVNTHEPENN